MPHGNLPAGVIAGRSSPSWNRSVGLADVNESMVSQYIGDAMKILASFDDTAIIEPFVSILDSEFGDLRLITGLLTGSRDRSGVRHMASLYRDDVGLLEEILNGPYSVDVKGLVVHILREIETQNANHLLTGILQGIDEDEFPLSGAAEPLCAVPTDKGRYTVDTRGHVAGALGRIGDPPAVAPLVAVLTDPDEEDDMLASFALNALESLVLAGEEFGDDRYD